MNEYEVDGVGAIINVKSSSGDRFRFLINFHKHGALSLNAAIWQAGSAPEDADILIDAAKGAALRWARLEFDKPNP